MGTFENISRNMTGMDPAPEIKEGILKRAQEAQKAELLENQTCSLCDQKTKPGNFCEKCGATFLTSEMIEKEEIN